MRIVLKVLIWFVILTVGLTAIYRFVPPPVTATMLLDPNGFTKDWETLANIDRNLVDAAIAAEDGKFCSHSGFDTEAIESAMERNAEGGRIRGGSTIRDCQDFRVRPGIMGNKESHYVTTQRTCHTE
jgi:monofunctional glycosyltransferase